MPAHEFRRYVNAMNNASLLAQRDLSELWENIEGLEPKAVRNALLAAVPGIVYKYGGMAAAAAAEYYEAERMDAGGPQDFSAELSEGVPLEQIEASVRYACGHLFPEEGGDGVRSEPDADLFGGED